MMTLALLAVLKCVRMITSGEGYFARSCVRRTTESVFSVFSFYELVDALYWRRECSLDLNYSL